MAAKKKRKQISEYINKQTSMNTVKVALTVQKKVNTAIYTKHIAMMKITAVKRREKKNPK